MEKYNCEGLNHARPYSKTREIVSRVYIFAAKTTILTAQPGNSLADKPVSIMSEIPPCPKCHSEYAYPSDGLLICSECFHEWNPDETPALVEEDVLQVLDSNGNVLQNGDSVIVIKDLPVKGMPKPVKAGTKVKNIRLTDGDHKIDCKIEGFGAMGLKSEFVRKA